MVKKPLPQPVPHFQYCKNDELGLMMRIRRSNWPPDMFEIVARYEFEYFKIMLENLRVPFEDLDE